MIDRFEEILQELSSILGIPLHSQNQTCTLLINEEMEVQLELDSTQSLLVVASIVTEVPPGKFRENVLKETLKYNYLSPRGPLFGYSTLHGTLILFSHLPLSSLKGEDLAAFLGDFIQKVTEWKTGVQSGNLPPLLPSKPFK